MLLCWWASGEPREGEEPESQLPVCLLDLRMSGAVLQPEDRIVVDRHSQLRKHADQSQEELSPLGIHFLVTRVATVILCLRLTISAHAEMVKIRAIDHSCKEPGTVFAPPRTTGSA